MCTPPVAFFVVHHAVEFAAVLEDGLEEGPWLLGEVFSAADVLVGSSVYFMKMFGLLPDSPVLEAYAERCLARPAYQQALARDAELSPQ